MCAKLETNSVGSLGAAEPTCTSYVQVGMSLGQEEEIQS